MKGIDTTALARHVARQYGEDDHLPRLATAEAIATAHTIGTVDVLMLMRFGFSEHDIRIFARRCDLGESIATAIRVVQTDLIRLAEINLYGAPSLVIDTVRDMLTVQP